MNIRVYIERIVLHDTGIDPSDTAGLHEAVQSQLVQLLGERGLHHGLQSSVSIPSLPAPGMQMPERRGSRALGVSVGQAIYKGIGQ